MFDLLLVAQATCNGTQVNLNLLTTATFQGSYIGKVQNASSCRITSLTIKYSELQSTAWGAPNSNRQKSYPVNIPPGGVHEFSLFATRPASIAQIYGTTASP